MNPNLILRNKAEALLGMEPSGTRVQVVEFEKLKIIHELEVTQIELELQNEELNLRNKEAEAAAQKYAEMYNFAPTGYITLSSEGEILEINLHASRMLGKDRTQLTNSRFGFFISNETKPTFNHFIEQVFKYNIIETCELTLSTNDSLPKTVYLTGSIAQNRENCLISMIDITERKNSEEILQNGLSLLYEIAKDQMRLFEIKN